MDLFIFFNSTSICFLFFEIQCIIFSVLHVLDFRKCFTFSRKNKSTPHGKVFLIQLCNKLINKAIYIVSPTHFPVLLIKLGLTLDSFIFYLGKAKDIGNSYSSYNSKTNIPAKQHTAPKSKTIILLLFPLRLLPFQLSGCEGFLCLDIVGGNAILPNTRNLFQF